MFTRSRSSFASHKYLACNGEDEGTSLSRGRYSIHVFLSQNAGVDFKRKKILLYEYRDLFIDMAVRNNRSELAIANRHQER